MHDGASFQYLARGPNETDVLWWDNTVPVGEKVQGNRFKTRINQFKRDQRNKTHNSNFSIDVVILTDEPAPLSEKGPKTVGLSIDKGHFKDLITSFRLSPSFARRELLSTGYHDYIKDDPSNHDESTLIFAARSPRLRNEYYFFTMIIWPPTNSTMCIITVPREPDREWLNDKMSGHRHSIMNCPVYLFNMLCEKLDNNNEELTFDVFSALEQQETVMEIYCAKTKESDAAEIDGRHPDENKIDGRQPDENKIDGRHPDENKIYNAHVKTIIQINFVSIKLMTLCCTTDFELSALGFAKSVMTRYNKLCAASNPANNLPKMSAEKLQDFDNEIESLQTVTRRRQTIRASAQQRAEQMVALLRASNAQRDTVYNQKMSENSRQTSSLARNLTVLGSAFIPPSLVAVSLCIS
ncbi:hypothetical protein F4678DRAFT_462899 [Xylaria arbuscula]|nr:hypothetical protein F4678DRAFT_462899 [Xylaria arbuscula]